ncbi:MAG: hypothetical protein NDI61_13615, partial [Bdellovibrionaceae bacterium]|nr:hypothetical protein [Pseudobdellovibrionaceae bacterium]
MVITTLALGTTSAFAQSPADAQLNPAPALPQGNMPAPATQQSQPNISAPIMAPPGSVMPSGTVPSGTQPIPGSTPIPNTGGPGAPAPAPTGPVTAAAPLSWGAQALADEITLSARDPEISVKKKKQARLSDEKVASLRSKIARLEGDMKSRMRLAEHFEVEGQPDKMIEVLRPVAADLPRKGMLALARGYRMKKDHKEEIRVLEILRAQKDKDYFVHYHLGAAYSSFGDRSTAIERFENALKLNPRFYPAYESLLRETKRDKRWTDAISIAQDTADRFGQKSKALSELCLLFAFQA